MKQEIEILLRSKIELLNNFTTINLEIETRLNTMRKINRSISAATGDANYCGETMFGVSLPDLLSMKAENDSYLQMLYDLKRDHSPYKDIKPKVLTSYDTGAIVYDSWGWEQTNIDYYCIVKRSGQFVTLLPMKKASGPEIGFMTRKETPKEIDFTGDPVRKKVRSHFGKETGFSMRDYAGGGWVSLYEGQPVTSTHYA